MHGTVFLSYSRHDSDYVTRLAQQLERAGLDVWYDYEILPGERFGQKIRDAIDASAVVVPVLTPAAAASEWVGREITYADQHRKPFVPLLLADCVKPMELISVQHHDVRGGLMPEQRFIDVLLRLCGHEPALTPPTRPLPVTPPTPRLSVAVPPPVVAAASSAEPATAPTRIEPPPSATGKPPADANVKRRRSVLVGAALAVVVVITSVTLIIVNVGGGGGAAAPGGRIVAVVQIRSTDGGAATDLDRARQVILHRLTTAGYGHPDVSANGADTLTVTVDDNGDVDGLTALLTPGELRFRKVLNQALDSATPLSATPPAGSSTSGPTGSPGTSHELPTALVQKLGPTASTAAGQLVASPPDDLTMIAGDAGLMAALEPFRQLTSAEIAILPPDMQFLVPQVTCDKLNAREPGAIAAKSSRVVACEADSHTKLLLDKATVDGADIASARAKNDNGMWTVDITFTSSGSKKWSALTSAAFTNANGDCAAAATAPSADGKAQVCEVAVVLDNVVISAPAIQGVLSAESTIAGSFDQASATRLAAEISDGALDAAITVVSISRQTSGTAS